LRLGSQVQGRSFAIQLAGALDAADHAGFLGKGHDDQQVVSAPRVLGDLVQGL
jgi:hypothetical protein